MSMPCPPAPNYVRRSGLSDCEYMQMGQNKKQAFHKAYIDSLTPSDIPESNRKNNYFHIGGLDMHTNQIFGYNNCGCPSVVRPNPACSIHGIARSNPVFGLGRSVLSVSDAASWNKRKGVKPSSTGTYSSTQSDSFIKDLWTAQVLAYWVTDGGAFKEAVDGGQVGLIRQRNFNPSDPSPLRLTSNGIAMTNLKSLLNPKGNNDSRFVLGPDGMFGPAAESIVEEWAGTGKLFGKSLSGKNAMALNRLAQNIKTPKIDAARAKKAAGKSVPSRREAAVTPCSQLSPEAQKARKDCVVSSGSGKGSTPTKKQSDKTQTAGNESVAEDSDDNTMLIAGVAGASILLIGVGVMVYKKRKQSRV